MESDHRKRDARAQSYASAIWPRCIREYVPTLNGRSKWWAPAEQHLVTSDLVWVVEETNSRCYCPTARFMELLYGSDSVARSAVLRLSTVSPVSPLVKHTRFLKFLFPGGGCYQVNERIIANKNRLFKYTESCASLRINARESSYNLISSKIKPRYVPF